jgi:hypothetical protein
MRAEMMSMVLEARQAATPPPEPPADETAEPPRRGPGRPRKQVDDG